MLALFQFSPDLPGLIMVERFKVVVKPVHAGRIDPSLAPVAHRSGVAAVNNNWPSVTVCENLASLNVENCRWLSPSVIGIFFKALSVPSDFSVAQ